MRSDGLAEYDILTSKILSLEKIRSRGATLLPKALDTGTPRTSQLKVREDFLVRNLVIARSSDVTT
jgi:hypothetical protein